MDLRPQAHEIIRTWLFYTVLRSHLEHGELPWRHAGISGWVLDPDRKKMSKSAGNVVTPMDSLRAHGSDAVRYWAARGRLGADMVFDPAQLRVGRRLAIKILNASKFVLSFSSHPEQRLRRRPSTPGFGEPDASDGDLAGASRETISEPLDAAMLDRLAGVIGQCTAALESYDHAGALAAAEEFFWFLCDDYLELVKGRAYGERGEAPARSARAALRLALSAVLRLFAPFLPYVTEEVWSWWQEGSVHRAPWPSPGEVLAVLARRDTASSGDTPRPDGPEPPDGQKAPVTSSLGPWPPAHGSSPELPSEVLLDAATQVIAAIRGAKSGARVSMRAPVRSLVVAARRDHLDAMMAILSDVQAAGRVETTELRVHDQAEPGYQVTL
jgi:valyl-tRNA synthetase